MIRRRYTGILDVDQHILLAALKRIHKSQARGTQSHPPKTGRVASSRVSKASR